MDVPLHTLRYFCTLAEVLHFGKAAETLSISSPSLSQQIARLEGAVGARLFVRSTRAVLLTDAGRELLPLARQVVQDHQVVLRWVRAHRGREGDEVLRIGLVASGVGVPVAAILAEAMEAIPMARFEIHRLGFVDAADGLLADTVDLVFAPSPVVVDDRLSVTPLWSEPRVLIVNSGHPLAKRTSVSVLETNGEMFHAGSGDSPEILDWWLVDPRPDGSRVKRGSSASDLEGLLELTAAGAGVSIGGASAAAHFPRDDLAFVPIHDIEPAVTLLCSLARPARRSVRTLAAIAARQCELHHPGVLELAAQNS